MLEAILGIFGSTGMGGLIGLAGGIASKWLEYKTIGQKLEFEKQMALIRAQELKLEMQHAIALADKQMEIAQVEGEIQRDVAEMAAFTESQKAGQKVYGGWVDQVRGLMRPVITMYLLAGSSMLTVLLWWTLGGLSAFPPEKLQNLFVHLVDSSVFLTVTAVLWWFGTRVGNLMQSKVK